MGHMVFRFRVVEICILHLGLDTSQGLSTEGGDALTTLGHVSRAHTYFLSGQHFGTS